MNLKYMKVSLFEISYKKKWTFSRHSNLLRCTCICKKKIFASKLSCELSNPVSLFLCKRRIFLLPPKTAHSSLHDRSPRHETHLNYAVAEHGSTPALTIPPPGKLLDVQAQAGTFSMLPVSWVFTGLCLLLQALTTLLWRPVNVSLQIACSPSSNH